MKARVWLLTAALVATVSSVRAEVRIVQTGARLGLQIRSSEQGIWKPASESRADDVLNPFGDVLGDGHPGHAFGRSGLLVAWERRSSRELVILHARSRDAAGTPTIARPLSAGLHGTPRVVPRGDGWLVAWTQGEGDHLDVAAVTVGSDLRVSEVVVLAPGQVVGIVPAADAQLVVSIDRLAGEIVISRPVGLEPFPLPVPPIVLRAPMATFTGARRGGRLLEPCVGRVGDAAIVAWQTPEGGFSFAVDAIGTLEGPHDLEAVPGSCTAVLNAAARR